MNEWYNNGINREIFSMKTTGKKLCKECPFCACETIMISQVGTWHNYGDEEKMVSVQTEISCSGCNANVNIHKEIEPSNPEGEHGENHIFIKYSVALDNLLNGIKTWNKRGVQREYEP